MTSNVIDIDALGVLLHLFVSFLPKAQDRGRPAPKTGA